MLCCTDRDALLIVANAGDSRSQVVPGCKPEHEWRSKIDTSAIDGVRSVAGVVRASTTPAVAERNILVFTEVPAVRSAGSAD